MEKSKSFFEEWYVTEDYMKTALARLYDDGVEMSTIFILPPLKDAKYYKVLYKKPTEIQE